tara:strand:- start:11985 stop:12395 length:411 start_codon:yes stop_codon:yes gene_type:complete
MNDKLLKGNQPSFTAAPNFIVVRLKKKFANTEGIILSQADELDYDALAPATIVSIGTAVKGNEHNHEFKIGTKILLRQYYQDVMVNSVLQKQNNLDVQLLRAETFEIKDKDGKTTSKVVEIFAITQPHEIVGICKD